MRHPVSHLTPADDPPVSELHVAAREIDPGDYLPPQRALHGTPYQHDGFTVGNGGRDVLTGMAGMPERMLLFGPVGTLDSIAPNTPVTVRRPSRHTEQTPAKPKEKTAESGRERDARRD